MEGFVIIFSIVIPVVFLAVLAAAFTYGLIHQAYAKQ